MHLSRYRFTPFLNDDSLAYSEPVSFTINLHMEASNLTRIDITVVSEAELIQRNTFAGKHIIHPTINTSSLSQNERPNAVRIPKPDDSKPY